MFCKHCGKDIDQYAKVCLHCHQSTGFLVGLDGKEKPDNLSLLTTLEIVSVPENNRKTEGKIVCKQCGYLNDAHRDNCSLCGCTLVKQDVAVAAAPQPVEVPAASGWAAAIAVPENRKKLIIGGLIAVEAFFVILIIALVVIFTGEGTAVSGADSTVSLKYVETSTTPSQVYIPSTITSYPGTVSNGLNLSALLTSEELAAMNSAMSSSQLLSQNPSSSRYNIIVPYPNITVPSQASPSSHNPSSQQTSSQVSSQAPNGIVQSSKPSSEEPSAVSSKPSSKPVSSRPVSSRPVSSQQPEPVSSREESSSEEPPVTTSEVSSVIGDGAYE